VLEVIGDVNYRVQQSVHSKKQVVHVDKMKRYLATAPLLWINPSGAPGLVDGPTPPELTFEDSFFVDLPESYEPWSVKEDPVDGLNQMDENEAIGSDPPDDDPAETEEDEISAADVSAPASPPPAATTDRPRRTVVKPARFCVVETTNDRPGQVHSTYETYRAGLATQPNSTVQACKPDAKAREIQPQAAIETRDDTREVVLVSEIEFEFGEEL